ncbi:hypothetical protein [Syntrophomonas palmitatica]|uniref:hypothetical protein n=1 Tax=Syntrophomonas palmitatica TaxID=402877 RepID=UPI0006D28E41|nr:hypothetical protein [Syntrophomonas palmitatica]
MNRKWETLLLVVLGLLIIGAVVYNARVMSRIYMVENGLDQDNKVCKARILPNQYDISIKQGEKVKMNLVVANEGNFIWMKGGSSRCICHIICWMKKRRCWFTIILVLNCRMISGRIVKLIWILSWGLSKSLELI